MELREVYHFAVLLPEYYVPQSDYICSSCAWGLRILAGTAREEECPIAEILYVGREGVILGVAIKVSEYLWS